MSLQPSLWEKEVFPASYDLIVVGAGIVGLSAAFFYKQRVPDARVLVLDRGPNPLGASTRNAGFACVGSIGEHLADLKKESEVRVKRRIKQRYGGLNLLKKMLGTKAVCYEHCGGCELFRSEKTFKETASQIGRFNRWMEELLGEESVYETGKIEGYPVIFNRLEGALHPGRMMRRLIRNATQTGVEISWNRPVREAAPAGTVVISGAGPALNAPKVILAVNGYTRRLLPAAEVKPVRGLVLVTNEQENLPWKGTFHHDRGYIYFRNVGNRLLIGGARNRFAEEEETDQFGINDKIRACLKDFISGVLRLPGGWRVEHQWSGIMGFTESKTPVVKQIDRHRYIAAGLSGMGIAIGMEVGRTIAKIANEE